MPSLACTGNPSTAKRNVGVEGTRTLVGEGCGTYHPVASHPRAEELAIGSRRSSPLPHPIVQGSEIITGVPLMTRSQACDWTVRIVATRGIRCSHHPRLNGGVTGSGTNHSLARLELPAQSRSRVAHLRDAKSRYISSVTAPGGPRLSTCTCRGLDEM